MDQNGIKNMINTLADYIPQATAWEQGFFESVKSQFEKRHTLSEKQIELVQKIAKKFSPEAIQEREIWYASWDEKEKEMIVIVKILWILLATAAKLSTIGLAAYILENMFGAIERIIDRHQGIVTV